MSAEAKEENASEMRTERRENRGAVGVEKREEC